MYKRNSGNIFSRLPIRRVPPNQRSSLLFSRSMSRQLTHVRTLTDQQPIHPKPHTRGNSKPVCISDVRADDHDRSWNEDDVWRLNGAVVYRGTIKRVFNEADGPWILYALPDQYTASRVDLPQHICIPSCEKCNYTNPNECLQCQYTSSLLSEIHKHGRVGHIYVYLQIYPPVLR